MTRTLILAHQFIPTLLNIKNGADPSAVAATLTDADVYLSQYPLDSHPSDQSGLVHAATLDSYNNGDIGPGHCGGPVETPTETTPTVPSVPPLEGGCTNSSGYWKNHAEKWPVDGLTLGGVAYSNAQLLDLLNNPARSDVTINLAQQAIAALLNVENGTDPAAAAETLTGANQFLSLNPPGSNPKDKGIRAEGNALAEQLDRYNNGRLGPSHCEDDKEGHEPASQMIEGGGDQIELPIVTGVVIENATPAPELEPTGEVDVTETAAVEPELVDSATVEPSPTVATPEPIATLEPSATPLPLATATPQPPTEEPTAPGPEPTVETPLPEATPEGSPAGI